MSEPILSSIFLGLLASASPCIFPLYPGFLAYLSTNQAGKTTRFFLGFFVLTGVLTMMLVIGGIIALLSISIGKALALILPLADLLIISLGILLLLNINPFKSVSSIQIPFISNPFANAFVYGLLYGPLALPCSGALVVGVFALSFTVGEALSKLEVFFWFGMGFGLPLLLLSVLAGTAQRWITRTLAMHNRLVNGIGGLILVAVGIFDLVQNWEMISAYLWR